MSFYDDCDEPLRRPATREMGAMELDFHNQIYELNELRAKIMDNSDDYYNWELTYNRIGLRIDKLYDQRDVAKILES